MCPRGSAGKLPACWARSPPPHPEEDLVPPQLCTLSGSHLAGVLVSFLLPAGVLDELLPGGELCLAAGLQPDGVHPPVLQVLAVVQDTDVLHDVKTTCPVEVNDAAKYARVPVEEELVVLEAVAVTQRQDVLVCRRPAELTQPRPQNTVLERGGRGIIHYLGLVSSSFHMTSCLDPPILSVTLGRNTRHRLIRWGEGTLSPLSWRSCSRSGE